MKSAKGMYTVLGICLLQDAMYETWGADLDDWETRECSDDELIGVLYSVSMRGLHPFRICSAYPIVLAGTGFRN